MKKRIVITGVSFLISLALLFCVIPSIAKYMTHFGKQSEMTSEHFYFTSNYLKADETPTYEILGNSITFEVRNYTDSLRVNPSDIRYTVSADGGALSESAGTLETGAAVSRGVTLTYEFAEGEDSKEITVTAASTDVYAEELKATFLLIKPGQLKYQIQDTAGRDYAELYIYTGNAAQSVTLSWDTAALSVDETNDYVFGRLNSDKSTVETRTVAADTVVKIVFFKKNINANYTCGLTRSDGTIGIS